MRDLGIRCRLKARRLAMSYSVSVRLKASSGGFLTLASACLPQLGHDIHLCTFNELGFY